MAEEDTTSKLAEDTSKRQKRSIEDDLVCPITLELPFHPVTAEDGRIYERAAIEQYFHSTTNTKQIRSPILNTPMGTRLTAAIQTKNHIEFLVENQLITGDSAERWVSKKTEKDDAEVMLKKAQEGDVKAMEHVAQYYYSKSESEQDLESSFVWHDKARRGGSVLGAEFAGYMLLKGKGVAKNEPKALLHLATAAGQGSKFAAYRLGIAFVNGLGGMAVDNDEATLWLQRAIDGDNTANVGCGMTEENLEHSQELLDWLREQDD